MPSCARRPNAQTPKHTKLKRPKSLDLEDAVHPLDKAQARLNAKDFIAQALPSMGRRQVAVRVNGTDTEWFKHDVEAFSGLHRPHAVLLAKAERVEQLDLVRSIVGEGPAIWCMIETPRGVLNAAALAAKSSVLVMGTVDLANELGCSTEPALARQPLMGALEHVVLASKSEGVQAVDGVYIHLNDDAGFETECAQGAALGFDGKSLIHPKTVAAANRAFSPSQQALDRARRVIEAYEAAGTGVVVLDGRLVEALHVRRAFALLDTARRVDG